MNRLKAKLVFKFSLFIFVVTNDYNNILRRTIVSWVELRKKQLENAFSLKKVIL